MSSACLGSVKHQVLSHWFDSTRIPRSPKAGDGHSTHWVILSGLSWNKVKQECTGFYLNHKDLLDSKPLLLLGMCMYAQFDVRLLTPPFAGQRHERKGSVWSIYYYSPFLQETVTGAVHFTPGVTPLTQQNLYCN